MTDTAGQNQTEELRMLIVQIAETNRRLGVLEQRMGAFEQRMGISTKNWTCSSRWQTGWKSVFPYLKTR